MHTESCFGPWSNGMLHNMVNYNSTQVLKFQTVILLGYGPCFVRDSLVLWIDKHKMHIFLQTIQNL